MVEGSTCGRAGRFFLRRIFLTLRSIGAETSLLVVVRAVDCSSGCASESAVVGAIGVPTSAILFGCS